jgi:hypothetical protein
MVEKLPSMGTRFEDLRRTNEHGAECWRLEARAQPHRGWCGLVERLFNEPLHSCIAYTTIMVIEFHEWSGQSSPIVGGRKQAADSS